MKPYPLPDAKIFLGRHDGFFHVFTGQADHKFNSVIEAISFCNHLGVNYKLEG